MSDFSLSPNQILLSKGEVRVEEHNQRFARQISTDRHEWLADEPQALGGDDLGPNPYEMLLAALGACTSMTLRIYANRKQWPLDDIQVTLRHRKENRSDSPAADIFERRILLIGESLAEEQRQRLLDIANKCPVHKTLTGSIQIDTELVG